MQISLFESVTTRPVGSNFRSSRLISLELPGCLQTLQTFAPVTCTPLLPGSGSYSGSLHPVGPGLEQLLQLEMEGEACLD